jgi:predicted enzyme related to lactoylglutathione lyase
MVTTADDKGNKALTGGMMKRQMPEQQGITTYFDVKSVQEYSAKVKQLGGKIFPNNAGARYGLFCYVHRYRE